MRCERISGKTPYKSICALLRVSGRRRRGGKVYMVREGLFDDVDAVIAWHPYHYWIIRLQEERLHLLTFNGMACRLMLYMRNRAGALSMRWNL